MSAPLNLYYADTGLGCGIKASRNLKEARAAFLRDVGEHAGVNCVRRATAEDIAWVKGMCGHVPTVSQKESQSK